MTHGYPNTAKGFSWFLGQWFCSASEGAGGRSTGGVYLFIQGKLNKNPSFALAVGTKSNRQ